MDQEKSPKNSMKATLTDEEEREQEEMDQELVEALNTPS